MEIPQNTQLLMTSDDLLGIDPFQGTGVERMLGGALILIFVSLGHATNEDLMTLWFPNELEHRIIWRLVVMFIVALTFLLFKHLLKHRMRRLQLGDVK